VEVRTSKTTTQILKDPNARRQFYRIAWNGGGSLRVGQTQYEIVTSTAQSVPGQSASQDSKRNEP